MTLVKHLGASIVVASFLSGCMMTYANEPVPATLTSVSASQKANIASIISQWFGGVEVTLADDAFTRSSELSIERKAHMDNRGLPIEGRHNNPAYTFTLLKHGERCILRNNQTGDEKEVVGLSCTASNE